jgi:dTMP kinase
MKSKLIGLCGLEGAGKSTATAVLAQFFAERNEPVTHVRQPGGTPYAEYLRSGHKQEWGNEHISAKTEMLTMFASFTQLYENVIAPALETSHVISDRMWACTKAYQIFGQNVLPLAEFDALKAWTCRDWREYDLVFWLDVDPATGLERARGRGELDRIEKQALGFFERAREGYQHSHDAEPTRFIRIDANQSEADVATQIRLALEHLMPQSPEQQQAEVDRHDARQALSRHLGLDNEDEQAHDAIEFCDVSDGYYRFRYARRTYVVAPIDAGLPTDIDVEYAGRRWAITTKYMVKITGVRHRINYQGQWDHLFGNIYEYYGNAHGGFKIIVGDDERIDMHPFWHTCINT